MERERVFTKGFNKVDIINPLLHSSTDFLKRFDGKGYYIFVEVYDSEFEISGSFNNKADLVFFRVTTNLYQTEVPIESIEKEENRYQIILQPKNKTALDPINRTVMLSLELN